MIKQGPVGIIGAMDVEIEAVLQSADIKEKQSHGGMVFYKGLLSGREIVVSRCHAGKVNSAICAQAMIDFYSVAAIINIGVAGGIGFGVHVGDVVIASGCLQYDYDASALGDHASVIELPNGESSEKLSEFICDKDISEKLIAAAQRLYDGKVYSGVIATGDKFVADPAFGNALNEKYSALACEMEGASIAHACRINRVPCAVLRSISDNANDDAVVDFPSFARSSAEKVQKLLVEVMGEL